MKNKIKMRRNKIRLTESQLHRVIKESVNRVLNENQGFMDGVQGAWNGIKGADNMTNMVKNAYKGYKQGQQGQQQVLNNRRTEDVAYVLNSLPALIQRATQAYQNGDMESLQDELEGIENEAQDLLYNLKRQAKGGINYQDDVDFSKY